MGTLNNSHHVSSRIAAAVAQLGKEIFITSAGVRSRGLADCVHMPHEYPWLAVGG